MTTTEKKLALEELKKELERSKRESERGDIVQSINILKDAVNNYSDNVNDYIITDYTDQIIYYSDVEQILIDKIKEDGIRGVVWFLEEIDKYNCDNYYYIIDDVFGNLKEVDALDVLDIISDIQDYLETK